MWNTFLLWLYEEYVMIGIINAILIIIRNRITFCVDIIYIINKANNN